MPQSDTVPATPRRWLQGLYFLALLLFVQPFIEAGSNTWPPRLGEITWRFGFGGIFSTMLPTVAFAMLVAATAAYLLGHRKTLRGIGWLALALALMLVFMLAGFGLDAVQLRKLVRAEAVGGFDMAVLKAVFVTLLAIVACIALGLGALRATALTPEPVLRRRAAGEGLLVGHAPRGDRR